MKPFPYVQLHFTLLAILLTLAACSSESPAPSAGTPVTPTAPVPSAPTARAPQSNANQIDEYKREVAQWISTRSNSHVYSNQPQALLRGVAVLSIQVDEQGAIRSVRTLRSPGDTELEQRAISSVWRAAPLPRPSASVLRGQRTLDFSETWLFNTDGRFQLRSIALAQKTTNF